MPVLDPIDKEILAILQVDTRTTIKAIAQQLNMTTTPIHERIKRLERRGVIQKHVALLNPQKIGKKLIAFISISLKEHHRSALEPFVKKVNSFSEVMECYHITGNYDFLLKVMVSGMEDYQTFIIDKLSVIPNIAHVQSSFVLSENKHTTAFHFD